MKEDKKPLTVFECRLINLINDCVKENIGGDLLETVVRDNSDNLVSVAVEENVGYSHLKKMLNKAYAIVAEQFKDIKDKGGNPYIRHIEYVSQQVENEMDIKVSNKYSSLGVYYMKCIIVALLHDLVEDTDYTLDKLRKEGFDEEIVTAVDAITRRDDEKHYFDFIERVSKNDIAKKVKIYDLENNMDASRLTKLGENELNRIKKYWYCREFLLGNIGSVECNNAIHPNRLFR